MPVEDDPSAGYSARQDWERAAKVRSVCIVGFESLICRKLTMRWSDLRA